MRSPTTLFLALAYLCFATGCVSAVHGLFPAPPGETPRTVYVLQRGWHTGVIVRSADIPSGVWPNEHLEFPDAVYLEFGWGDSQGYRYPLTSGIAMRSAFASKGSVLFIHAFSGCITNEYAGIANEIIGVQLSTNGFDRFCAYIRNTYALDALGRPIVMPTVYSDRDFFQAHGHYSAVNNCNNWTARALRTAGCPIRAWHSWFPGNVMRRCRGFGHVEPVCTGATVDAIERSKRFVGHR